MSTLQRLWLRYKTYLIKGIGFVGLTVLGLILHHAKHTPPTVVSIPTIPDSSPVISTPPTKKTTITIHISGAVYRPGVYTLATGSRIHDALTVAGNHLPSADLNQLNLAKTLRDGMQLLIPFHTQATPQRLSHSSPSSSLTVSLNHSTQAELETLSGIGPKLAKRIVNYRHENGRFTSVTDLTKVSGIGPKHLQKIRHAIRL